MVCDEVGHGLGGFQPHSSSLWATRSGWLANEAAGAQIRKGVNVIHRDQPCDATAAHGHDDLRAVVDVLDVAAEAVVQLAYAHFSLQRFGMWRHDGRLYALHRGLSGMSSLATLPARLAPMVAIPVRPEWVMPAS
ncbi:MAG: hypothetical protein WKF94_05790 [Solirubrobacteraceae bacterium]